MELEYIGPVSGYTEGKNFVSIWTFVAGLNRKDAEGCFRYENAEFITEGNELFLFWQKDNRSDKNAVAVFTDEDALYQIGYVPREHSKSCIDAYKKGYLRIGAVAKRIFHGYKSQARADRGDYFDNEIVQNIKMLLVEFCDVNEAYKKDTYDFFNICKGIKKPVLDSLREASLLDYAELSQASDKDILKVKGVGRKALSIIREVCPQKELP